MPFSGGQLCLVQSKKEKEMDAKKKDAFKTWGVVALIVAALVVIMVVTRVLQKNKKPSTEEPTKAAVKTDPPPKDDSKPPSPPKDDSKSNPPETKPPEDPCNRSKTNVIQNPSFLDPPLPSSERYYDQALRVRGSQNDVVDAVSSWTVVSGNVLRFLSTDPATGYVPAPGGNRTCLLMSKDNATIQQIVSNLKPECTYYFYIMAMNTPINPLEPPKPATLSAFLDEMVVMPPTLLPVPSVLYAGTEQNEMNTYGPYPVTPRNGASNVLKIVLTNRTSPVNVACAIGNVSLTSQIDPLMPNQDVVNDPLKCMMLQPNMLMNPSFQDVINGVILGWEKSFNTAIVPTVYPNWTFLEAPGGNKQYVGLALNNAFIKQSVWLDPNCVYYLSLMAVSRPTFTTGSLTAYLDDKVLMPATSIPPSILSYGISEQNRMRVYGPFSTAGLNLTEKKKYSFKIVLTGTDGVDSPVCCAIGNVSLSTTRSPTMPNQPAKPQDT